MSNQPENGRYHCNSCTLDYNYYSGETMSDKGSCPDGQPMCPKCYLCLCTALEDPLNQVLLNEAQIPEVLDATYDQIIDKTEDNIITTKNIAVDIIICPSCEDYLAYCICHELKRYR